MPHLERLVPDEENQIGVLYIHTFNDYFWNAEMAQEFFDEVKKIPNRYHHNHEYRIQI